MHENEVATQVVDAAYQIHCRLGPGLLESVYEAVLAHELAKRGCSVERQVSIPLVWDAVKLDVGFRMDMLVGGNVAVELKSIEQVAPVHKKQVLTYMRLANLRLGLLINFGAYLIKDGIWRIANGLDDP